MTHLDQPPMSKVSAAMTGMSEPQPDNGEHTFDDAYIDRLASKLAQQAETGRGGNPNRGVDVRRSSMRELGVQESEAGERRGAREREERAELVES